MSVKKYGQGKGGEAGAKRPYPMATDDTRRKIRANSESSLLFRFSKSADGFVAREHQMSFLNLSLVYDCGYGGCKAPSRPVSVSCPDPSGTWPFDEIGRPIWIDTSSRRDLTITSSFR